MYGSKNSPCSSKTIFNKSRIIHYVMFNYFILVLQNNWLLDMATFNCNIIVQFNWKGKTILLTRAQTKDVYIYIEVLISKEVNFNILI